MAIMADGECPNCERLKKEVERLSRELERRNRDIANLIRRVEELERAGKRQASPFSKGEPKERPKDSGQKEGHVGAFRPEPDPSQVNRRVNVPPPDGGRCPDCNAPLHKSRRRVVRQYMVDIPPPPPPDVTEFTHDARWCPQCRKWVAGRHPDQIADPLGPSRVVLGPRLIAYAAQLRFGQGVPFRDVAVFLLAFYCLRVSHGALVRACHRLADRLDPTVGLIRVEIRTALLKWIDETGWRMNGRNAWLWVFVTLRASLFLIRKRRGHEVPADVIGLHFTGILHCDGFLAYDSLIGDKQTCYFHILKAVRKILETNKGLAARFPRQVRRLLRDALRLRRRKDRMSMTDYARRRDRLRDRLHRLVRLDREEGRAFYNEANDALSGRLYRLQDQLFTFLDTPDADATNSRAEREVRPGVIIRKICGGCRTERGARSFENITSTLRTVERQAGLRFDNLVIAVLRNPDPEYAYPIFGRAPPPLPAPHATYLSACPVAVSAAGG